MYKQSYEGKVCEFDFTNNLTKCVFVGRIKTIQFQMLQNLLGKLNLLEMKAISYLLTDHNSFSIIYNGSHHKRNL